MNNYEFQYEDYDGRHAEAVEARSLNAAKQFFAVTHPRGVARIIAIVVGGVKQSLAPVAALPFTLALIKH